MKKRLNIDFFSFLIRSQQLWRLCYKHSSFVNRHDIIRLQRCNFSVFRLSYESFKLNECEERNSNTKRLVSSHSLMKNDFFQWFSYFYGAQRKIIICPFPSRLSQCNLHIRFHTASITTYRTFCVTKRQTRRPIHAALKIIIIYSKILPSREIAYKCAVSLSIRLFGCVQSKYPS